MKTRNAPFYPSRRTLLLAATALPVLQFAGAFRAIAAEIADKTANDQGSVQASLAALESSAGGRLGLAMLDMEGKPMLAYRSSERFPLCSTFKLMLAATILQRSTEDASFLARRLRINKGALIHHSPETEKHVGKDMRIDELCAATMEYSDNTAANLLLDAIGGTKAVTAYARSIGDNDFSLVRMEPAMSTAIPGDDRDTTSPMAMAHSLQRLALGQALQVPQRGQFLNWLRNNTTGGKRIRAAVPADWQVGDKTGSGDYGTTNDVALLVRPNQPPLILAIYFTQKKKDAPLRDDVVAQATRIALAGLA